MFVISTTYIKPASEVEAVLDAHRQYVSEQYASGMFLMSGRKVPRNGGIILAVAASRAAIEAVVQADPFYTKGVAAFDIVEFEPTMTADAFAAFGPAAGSN